ncbi:MAG TPA: secondary thiamine-phosphate synthase enzyme YjbQ [Geobacteraceae bacterium]|nr:secondary thiamine-phosphate synthase enzyme YjbQ [Geobacteraceae bacterium]
MIRYIEVKSRRRTEFIDITAEVKEMTRRANIASGICCLFVLHTTAGITVNEGADPAVQHDIITFLNKLVPADHYFTHAEGNSDAHIKSSLVGTSQTLLVENGMPVLGTWQSIYFCEFDGPRQRKVAVKIVPDP